ncbi:ABC transporter substrate-binding protein [Agrobacterium sp. ES01]|uniref:ABC transporter substrate-binding protein n=1 Tax=Agrobacterium sp. ES01 TaxID=3420714 RepID=UPI003D13DD70
MIEKIFRFGLVASLLIAFSPRGYAVAADMDFSAVATNADETLTIASVTDLEAIRPMIEGFQRHYPGIAVHYRESESSSLDVATSQACKEDRFLADLIISSSVPQQVALVNNGCAQKVDAASASLLPAWARWRSELVGLTAEPAVIVYNKKAFEELPVPDDRFELIDLLRKSDRFVGKIGSYNIATSGVGYFFAFEDAAQASTWGRIIEAFGRNRVQFYCCTSDILDRVADGRLSIGYNVLGSYTLSRVETDNRIGVIFPSDYTLVMTRAALISRQAVAPGAANKFLAFALSPEGKSILEKKMHFFSAVDGVDKLSELAPGEGNSIRPIALTPTLIIALDKEKRRVFLEQWRKSVLVSGP